VRRRLLLVPLLVLLGVVALTDVAAAQTADRSVTITGTIGGRDITTGKTSEDALPLDPDELIPVRLTLRNQTDQTEEIRYVRLEGKALGLTFLTYDFGARAVLGPHDRTVIETKLDFFDLESQATGFLGTSIRVYDGNGFLIGEQRFVVDVLGKPNSTLGSFALIVFGLAVFSVAVIIVNTIRRRLPSNRFVRGLQFAMAGAAIGVTLSLGVSILRIGFADVDDWVRLVFTPTAIAFILGYLAPGPLQRSIRDYQAEEALEAAAHVAVARSSGVNPVVAEEALRSLQQGPLRLSGGRGTGRNSGRSSGRISSRTSAKTSGQGIGRGTQGNAIVRDRVTGGVPRSSGSQAPADGRSSGSLAPIKGRKTRKQRTSEAKAAKARTSGAQPPVDRTSGPQAPVERTSGPQPPAGDAEPHRLPPDDEGDGNRWTRRRK
jgi:hypothetical protein